MQTLTLANIYELQGLKEDALEIYKEILKKDPSNADAKIAIRRLSGMRKKFLGVNNEMKAFFVQMDEEAEFIQFERWLMKAWN
ncbi:MAG: tetratricopeptide repeat protein [Sulfuricurvum sp.]|jgi:tetratricopeptide (TPR) repeat protein|uniref:tetratricopeptide repeat protein n=1 Tax=Sulfuricurvum sp. TaxID=2025608 RepID=UPI0026204760|nr:tetratricopeptide repeat protein [Sulfuricurvum sp.]MDD2266586.1 tetratricopeptide repeat protein [Sulfuricurvum sp.]MDD2367979.1 tetratricopeptide repeat protein [Sulfuricurvum sp.]MDD2783534.1 tetratricopeptide repeat protein [Sulfuricurvum sp.]MDD2838565.1 tetratricopeptide repeat protein [Sulfuricurvum sp.]MDD2949934.1 tetratricopeptide repeat protein [Sulfuricurvum sp.]